MRIVLVGEPNVKKINQLKSQFSFNQPSHFTTHIAGGILGLF